MFKAINERQTATQNSVREARLGAGNCFWTSAQTDRRGALLFAQLKALTEKMSNWKSMHW